MNIYLSEETNRLLLSQAILSNIDILVEASVDHQYALEPDFWRSFGKEGYRKSIRDARYNYYYLAEALSLDEPILFFDYFGWLKSIFYSLKFPSTAIYTTLDCMKTALQVKLLDIDITKAVEYIESAKRYLMQVNEIQESYLSPASPYYSLAKEYLEIVLNGDRKRGSEIILHALSQGISISDIYLYVFQPCLEEVGRLWQNNQISTAHEHYFTVATQTLMSQLSSYITSNKKGLKALATSIGNELHDVGVRMVADFFEMDGWEVYYLGANTPTESILDYLEQVKPNILAVSLTISYHISKVSSLIEEVRKKYDKSKIKIMVGGAAFNLSDTLWKRVGADGYASNAQEAVHVANKLVMN